MSSAVGRAFPDYLVHVFEPQSRLPISFSSAMDLTDLKTDSSLLNHSTPRATQFQDRGGRKL